VLLKCLFGQIAGSKWRKTGLVRSYYRKRADGLLITRAQPEHAIQLEGLQRVCFPTLADVQRFKAVHYIKHMELFDSGQLVAIDGETVIGATATVRLNFDFNHVDHTFADIIQDG
jgi:hypothetical protein